MLGRLHVRSTRHTPESYWLLFILSRNLLADPTSKAQKFIYPTAISKLFFNFTVPDTVKFITVTGNTVTYLQFLLEKYI